MKTRRVAKLDLNQADLHDELSVIDRFEWSRAYSSYICGGPWLSCMLWTVSGEAGDGVITHYDHSRGLGLTEYGAQLPYLREIVERHFHLEALQFARLAILKPGSVIIPHKDLLELDAPMHRAHIPLITDDDSYFTEGDAVFNMRFGELWMLDAGDVHSAACLSETDRVHLILDFHGDATLEDITPHASGAPLGPPPDSIVDRASLPSSERAALLGLGEIMDVTNHRDVMRMVIKHHYKRDGGPGFVWSMLLEIADQCPDAHAAERIRALHRYFLTERDAAEPA